MTTADPIVMQPTGQMDRRASVPGIHKRSNAGTYVAPLWLPGRHSQTLYSACLMQISRPVFEQRVWRMPSREQIAADITQGRSHMPVLVLIHGLEGGSRSHYACALASHFSGIGWTIVIPHFRTPENDLCIQQTDGRKSHGERIDWVIGQIASNCGSRGLYAVGVSLGDNLLLRWLARAADDGHAVFEAAAVVSTPIDLAGSFKCVSQGLARIYHWYFRRLRESRRLIARTLSGARFPDRSHLQRQRAGRPQADFHSDPAAERQKQSPYLVRVASPAARKSRSHWCSSTQKPADIWVL